MKHETRKLTISIIVALDKNRAIGKDNDLLWDIPEDLKHFREVTSGHPIIMGRKTHESIGRSLSNRTNIVITSNSDVVIADCIVVNSIENAIAKASEIDQEEIFIIGGGQIYKQTLPFADKLYITYVEGEYQADVHFPDYHNEFKVVKEEQYNNGKYKFSFRELVRKQ